MTVVTSMQTRTVGDQLHDYGLKTATPAAPYMAVPNEAVKLWGPGVPATA